MLPPVASILTPFRDVLEGLERFFSGLTLTDLALLVLAGGIVWWVIATARSGVQVGPVEIDPLESDDDQEPVKAHSAALRERLALSGLSPPPEVPAGAPRTAVIEAISTSPAPQGPWLAGLLEVLPSPPSPPSYRLSGTLTSEDDGYGLAYWLRPKKHGNTRVRTAAGATAEEAVHRTATQIYLEITNNEPYAYPPWARWRDPEAFDCYFRGLEARDGLVPGADLGPALTPFEEAIDREPRNLLPSLQIANLLERQAAAPDAGELTAAALRLKAMRAYREITIREDTIVEARYRYGILLSMLQHDWEHLDAAQRAEIAAVLEVSLQEAQAELQQQANEETKAVKRMLGASWALRQPRLRHRFELKGNDRRQLKRTVAVSARCMWARKVAAPTNRRGRWRIRWEDFRVRRLEVGWFRLSEGWQAHYNAACFYALLAARDKPNLDGPAREKWLERGFEQLESAIDQPEADQLPCDWLIHGDVDLEELRKPAHRARWEPLVRRHCGPPPPPVIVRSSKGEPIRSIAQWQRLAPPPRGRRWERQRSAYELARAWTTPVGLNALADALRLDVHRAEAGAITTLDPERGGTYRHDLLVARETPDDPQVTLASIRATAEETLGPTVREQLAAATSPQRAVLLARLGRLQERFGFEASQARISPLRYCLFVALAATLTAAKEKGATRAVFVVHAFETRLTTQEHHTKNMDDLADFVEIVFGRDVEEGAAYLVGPPGLSLPDPQEPDLCVAFIKTRAQED